MYLCAWLMYTRNTSTVAANCRAIVTHNRVSIPKEPQTPREIRCDTRNTPGQSIPSRSLPSPREEGGIYLYAEKHAAAFFVLQARSPIRVDRLKSSFDIDRQHL